MKFLIIILSILTGFNGGAVTNETSVTVDRIEGDYAVIEIAKGENVKMIDVLMEDFNNPVTEGEKLNFTEVKGKFYQNATHEGTNMQGETDIYYQFKSNDNSVWWALTLEDIIGVTAESPCSLEELEKIEHFPDYDKEYILTYYNNGTTAENKNCGCLPEWECECEVYDDIFLTITEASK